MTQQSKPSIPMKNLVIFLIASVGIMFAWTWIDNKFFKTPPPPPPTPLTEEQYRDVFNHCAPLLALKGAAGSAEPWNYIALEIGRPISKTPPSKVLDEGLANTKKDEEARLEARKKELAAQPKPDLVQLGDANYNLQVRLTTWGGGVDRVVVTNFLQADRYGQPVLNADKTPQKLHLIPSPNDLPEEERENLSRERARPSFLLYHYAQPDALRPEPLLGDKTWTLVDRPGDVASGRQEVSFRAELPEFGARITKTFSLERDHYHVGLALKIEKIPGATAKPLRYQLAGAHGLPIEGEWYTSVYRNFIAGWKENGTDKRQLETSAEIHTNLGSERFTRQENEFQYAAVAGQYFAVATCIDDDQENRNFIEFARATAEGSHPKGRPMLGDLTPRVNAAPLTAGDKPVVHKFVLYHGPIKVRQLYQLPEHAVPDELVERYEKKLGLRTMTDFHSASWIGRFANTIGWTDLTVAFTNIMHSVLGFFMRHLQVPVLAILALTVLVRLLLMPLSRKQTASMTRLQEKMAAMQPKLKELEESYKGKDQKEFQQAKMKMMLANGVNPAAYLGGCLPTLVQMPIFMGLWYALQENVFFRLRSFLWIDNLAAPDMLVPWGEKIPFISDPENLGAIYYLGPFFNILPFLAVALMLVQQWLMTPPPADEQQASQQKMMRWMMILFAVFFYKTPSALVLYFIFGTVWALAERKLFPKKTSTAKPDEMGGNAARLKIKPEPPKESWLQRKARELIQAAEKKNNTERRHPQSKKTRPR